MSLNLKKFDMNDIKFPDGAPKIVMIGKRDTGASYLCKELLFTNKDEQIEKPIHISPNPEFIKNANDKPYFKDKKNFFIISTETVVNDSDINQDDIKLIIEQTNCTYEQAFHTLKKNGGDIVNAIIDITT